MKKLLFSPACVVKQLSKALISAGCPTRASVHYAGEQYSLHETRRWVMQESLDAGRYRRTHRTSSQELQAVRVDDFLLAGSFSLAADNQMFRLIMKRAGSNPDCVHAGSAYSQRKRRRVVGWGARWAEKSVGGDSQVWIPTGTTGAKAIR